MSGVLSSSSTLLGWITTIGITPVSSVAVITTLMPITESKQTLASQASSTFTLTSTATTLTAEVTEKSATPRPAIPSSVSSILASSTTSNDLTFSITSSTSPSSYTSNPPATSLISTKYSFSATFQSSSTLPCFTTTSSSYATTAALPKGLDEGDKAGIGASGALAGVLVVAALLFFSLRMPRARQSHNLFRCTKMLKWTNREAQQGAGLPMTCPSTAAYLVALQHATESWTGNPHHENRRPAELPGALVQDMTKSPPREPPLDMPIDVAAISPPASELSFPISARPSLRATLNTTEDWRTGLHELGTDGI